MVENLGLAGLGFGDEEVIEHIEDILTHGLELVLDLLAVLADGADVLVRALGFLLLLDGRDDAPRGATGAHDVLVRHGQQISLINAKFSTDLLVLVLGVGDLVRECAYLCNFLRSGELWQ